MPLMARAASGTPLHHQPKLQARVRLREMAFTAVNDDQWGRCFLLLALPLV